METKRAKVIMLPTDNTNNPVLFKYLSGKLSIDFKKEPATMHHIYIIIDDKIKEGDWFLLDNTVQIAGRKGIRNFKEIILLPEHNCKKIVATTNKSLIKYIDGDNPSIGEFIPVHLPKPSKAFIQKYCELGGIDEVLIEYTGTQWYNKRFGGTWQPFPDEQATIKRNIPKIDSIHNTITIHPIKDSWTREDMLQAYRDGVNDGENRTLGPIADGRDEDENNWIKKHLN